MPAHVPRFHPFSERPGCCEMTKDVLNWSDTTCLIVYLMLCTTILCCYLINECVSRTFLHYVTLTVHVDPYNLLVCEELIRNTGCLTGPYVCLLCTFERLVARLLGITLIHMYNDKHQCYHKHTSYALSTAAVIRIGKQ
jgi:hypothetical protein